MTSDPKRRELRLASLSASIALLPILVWIALDRSVWPWDQAFYGTHSVDLFYSIAGGPMAWISSHFSAVGFKAPGVAWVGQYFVPLGVLLGSCNFGLMLSVFMFHWLALFFFFRLLTGLTRGSLFLASLGVFSLASAPLFVGLGLHYLVEPMQNFMLVWTLWGAWSANRWDRKTYFIFAVACLSAGLLVKISTPFYLIVPLVFGFYRNVRGGKPLKPKATHRSRLFFVQALIVSLLCVATFAWYFRNGTAVLAFTRDAANGFSAELGGGRHLSIFAKLAYWANTIVQSSFIPYVAVFFVALVVVAAGKRFNARRKLDELDRWAAVAAFEIVAVLCMFSLQVNEQQRYSLPLISLVVILVIWALARINSRKLEFVCLGVIALQWFLSNATIFRAQFPFTHLRRFTAIVLERPAWMPFLERNPFNAHRLEAVIHQTCLGHPANQRIIVGIELRDFSADALNYFAAQAQRDGRLRCRFFAIGFGSLSVDETWKEIERLKPDYFVTIPRNQYPITKDRVNREATNLNATILRG